MTLHVSSAPLCVRSRSVARLRLGWGGLIVATLLLCAQTGGSAAVPADLPYTKSFLITGDYAVGAVDLTEQANPIDVDGFSTGTISISGVPAGADILGAYLFWETITLGADDSTAEGVKFRGQPIDVNSVVAVKRASELPQTQQGAACFANGVPLASDMFRADVLGLLPMQVDKDDKATGKRVVNSADLTANGLGGHTVTLPVRNGNDIPESAGATLVVIYRDTTQPLRKIVIYNGNASLLLSSPLERVIQGFYKSAATPSAKITYIVASGQPNNNDRISFNDVVIANDPFPAGSASQRAWAVNATYNVSSLMNRATTSSVYGETVKTKVYHQPTGGGEDCLNWGGVIFSTAVADVDHDGLPDGLEDAVNGLKDPDDAELPNLNAMGARSRDTLPNGAPHPDIFIEFNSMWAAPGTSYGSPSAPYNATTVTKTDTAGHNHVPTPEVLKMLGDGYAAKGITAHFDVGDLTAYHGLGTIQHSDWVDDYASTEAEAYLVASPFARGGEVIKEVACVPSATVTCQFPAYPGTVRWKLGLQIYRDGAVGDNGQELAPADIPAWLAGSTHRRRFDPARRGLFHYVLNAHNRAKPKSSLPCLVSGVPGPYDKDNNTACNVDNPDFHTPSTTSGIADVPGGNVLTSLGGWGEFVGRPFARAATVFHELGHNLELYHGGAAPIWGSKALNTATYVEPNCKPNYLSSMSYLFQVHGLFDNDDQIHLDYSGAAHSGIGEQVTVSDAPLSPAALYQPAWFAPAGSTLAVRQGGSAASRFCGGASFNPLSPPPPTARVQATSTSAAIDWDGNPLTSTVAAGDRNFDGAITASPKQLNGFNDWAKVRLDQIGAGRDVSTGLTEGSIGEGVFAELAEGVFAELAEGVFAELAEGVFAELAEGVFAELAEGVFAELAEGVFAELAEGQEELNYALAKGMSIGRPYGLTACVIGEPGCTVAAPFDAAYHRVELRFHASTVGDINDYEVQRKRASAGDNTYVTVGSSTTNLFIDPTELADGVQYAYRVRARTSEGNSGWSKAAVVTAKNNAPVAVAEAYAITNKQTLAIAAPGLLANDSDGDTGPVFTGRRVLLVSGPSSGTLTLNANGSFTYKPKGGFTGIVSFTYKVDDGLSGDAPIVPLSAASAPVTVTITIAK